MISCSSSETSGNSCFFIDRPSERYIVMFSAIDTLLETLPWPYFWFGKYCTFLRYLFVVFDISGNNIITSPACSSFSHFQHEFRWVIRDVVAKLPINVRRNCDGLRTHHASCQVRNFCASVDCSQSIFGNRCGYIADHLCLLERCE